MSGFSKRVRQAILERDGERCVRCWAHSTQIHHRRTQGMGGTSDPEANTTSNGIVICGMGNASGCHRWCDQERGQAVAYGLVVPQGVSPATVPILMGPEGHSRWFLLDDLGRRHRTQVSV